MISAQLPARRYSWLYFPVTSLDFDSDLHLHLRFRPQQLTPLQPRQSSPNHCRLNYSGLHTILHCIPTSIYVPLILSYDLLCTWCIFLLSSFSLHIQNVTIVQSHWTIKITIALRYSLRCSHVLFTFVCRYNKIRRDIYSSVFEGHLLGWQCSSCDFWDSRPLSYRQVLEVRMFHKITSPLYMYGTHGP